MRVTSSWPHGQKMGFKVLKTNKWVGSSSALVVVLFWKIKILTWTIINHWNWKTSSFLNIGQWSLYPCRKWTTWGPEPNQWRHNRRNVQPTAQRCVHALPAYPAFSDGIGVDFNFSSVELTVLHMKMPLACRMEFRSPSQSQGGSQRPWSLSSFSRADMASKQIPQSILRYVLKVFFYMQILIGTDVTLLWCPFLSVTEVCWWNSEIRILKDVNQTIREASTATCSWQKFWPWAVLL